MDNETTIAECIEFITDRAGLVLSDVQVLRLVTSDDGMDADLEEWGVSETETGSRLADAQSEFLLGRPWPTYGDALDPDAFLAALQDAARARGFAVTTT